MLPWDRLPKNLQRAILLMIVLGGAGAGCRVAPLLCDPAPPPTHTPMIFDPPPPPLTGTPSNPSRSTAPASDDTAGPVLQRVQFAAKTPMVFDPPPPPAASRTPMICDPPPPPLRTRRPTPTPPMVCDAAPAPSRTPMICDPPPPPSPVATSELQTTPVPGQRFLGAVVVRAVNPALPGSAVAGKFINPEGWVVADLPLVLRCGAEEERTFTNSEGDYALPAPGLGVCTLAVEGYEADAVRVTLEDHEIVVIDWVETRMEASAPLPLAEIRSVNVVWSEGLTFAADTPWPGARYRWTASAGTLTVNGDRAMWQPPNQPGRCLLQVAADWGRAGLAVSAIGLQVDEDGDVTIIS